jgi:hypothetical protein
LSVSDTFVLLSDRSKAKAVEEPGFASPVCWSRHHHSARFFIPPVSAEIEFVPDAGGAIASLVLHQGGQDIPAKRH